MSSEPVTIGELVDALETTESYIHAIKELMKTLPRDQRIVPANGEGGLPRFKGCDQPDRSDPPEG